MSFTKIGGQFLLVASLCFAQGALAQQFVCVESNVGEFCMEMYTESAPNTVANFLNYVEAGDFDNTLVHRSIPEYIIQTGGYYSNPLGVEVPMDAPVANEFSLPNSRGSVAMAKLPNDPDSATTEWFVNLGNNGGELDFSNGGYTVFARIVRGMDVLDTIGGSLRSDFRQYDFLGAAFGEVPVLRKPAAGIGIEDFVLIHRVYATDALPPAALTVFDGGSLVFPVQVGDYDYLATLELTGDSLNPVFKAERSQLVPIVASDRETAVYSGADKQLVIPSVRIGERVITDVRLNLIDLQELEFELDSFSEE